MTGVGAGARTGGGAGAGGGVGAGPTGLTWRSSGQSVLSGPLLTAARHVDAALRGLGDPWACEEFAFPPFLPAAELDRIDYFAAFPHLATFPVTVAADPAALDAFAAASPLRPDATVALPALGPVRDVLTPAACYHFYVHLQGAVLAGPRYLTTRATCFRNETAYQPLRRQSAFSMRELVCVGTRQEVRAFVAAVRERVDGLLCALDLSARWEPATDPFFRPARSGRHLMQRLDPVKFEAVCAGAAIASANTHHDHFGAAFGIGRCGVPAHSGCVAFGLERWLFALADRHGPDPADWPPLPRTGAGDG